jgi:hypothetical protein
MKPLGQDKSAQLLHQTVHEESKTDGFPNKLAEQVANPEPLIELQFASISLDPNGNIITWNTNMLCGHDVRAAVESVCLLRVSNMRQTRQRRLDVRFAYGF